MNLHKAKELHNDATELLELIEYADERIKNRLEFINGAGGNLYDRLADKAKRENEITERAKVRLLRSYDRLLAEIFNNLNR